MEASKEVQKWADRAMYESEPQPGGIRVSLLSATPDPLGSIAAMCAMYEGRVVRNLTEVSDDDRRRYWEQVKKTHLKAPLEAVDLHFMIEGVSRSFTHQMVRQRTAVYAQESLRFAVKEGLSEEIPLPPSIREDSIEAGAWKGAIEGVEEVYDYLIANGIPAEDARGLLPHATTTRLNYKTNLRNLVDHAGNRLCTQAQFEWRMVFSRLVESIRGYDDAQYHHPAESVGDTTYGGSYSSWQFELIADDDLFRPVCYAVGHCPFQADFDRGCTIRERVDAGRFDEIDPKEWLLDPAAARVR